MNAPFQARAGLRDPFQAFVCDDATADMLLDQGIVRVRLTAADDVDVERLVHDAVHPAVTRLTTVAEMATPPTPQVDLRLRPRSGRALQ